MLGGLLLIKQFDVAPNSSITIDLKAIPSTIYVSVPMVGYVYGVKLDYNGVGFTTESNTTNVITYSLSSGSGSSNLLTINNASVSSSYKVTITGNSTITLSQ